MSPNAERRRLRAPQIGAVALAVAVGLVIFNIARPAANPPSTTAQPEVDAGSLPGSSTPATATVEAPASSITPGSTTTLVETSPTLDVPAATTIGAGAVGPAQEARTTEGVLVEGPRFASAIESARAGTVILLRGGDYSGGFLIPSGVTVKPYNGESVTITGSVTMSSTSVLAGVDLRSSGEWAIRVDSPSGAKSDITIRNNVITGGSVETIRVSRNVSGVLIAGNDISGGGNHAIKVHGEGSGHSPSATISGNLIHDPSREDAIQTEDNGPVVIDRNTFYGTPENAIDVKTGQVVAVTNNLFDGSSISAEALLVHGHGVTVAVHNRFADGADIGLGSASIGNPMMTLRDNRVDGGDIVIRLSTQPIVIEANSVTRGTLKLGISGGDHPTDATVTGNVFEGTELLDRVTPSGDSWACTGNTLIEVIGDWSGCT